MPRLRALTDSVVTLDEPREVDAAAMVAAQDEGTRAAFGDDRPDTVEKAERWLAAARRLWAEQQDTFDGRWAIRSVGHPALIGWLSLTQAGDRANVRAWLGPEARGRQRGTRAVRLACDFAFSEIGVDLIEAHIIPGNAPSRSLARSLGFTINPDRLTTSTDHTGMALVYELPRSASPPAPEHATKADLRRELASAEAELAAYDPADHLVATPPGRMGDLIRDHFHTKKKALLEDRVEFAKRRLRDLQSAPWNRADGSPRLPSRATHPRSQAGAVRAGASNGSPTSTPPLAGDRGEKETRRPKTAIRTA